MRIFFRKTKAFAIFALSALLAACTTHEFDHEQDKDEEEPGESTNGIPGDFDYSTTDSHKLTVKVVDEYEGRYYYTVEVYNANPLFESAELICGAKTNMNTPFVMDIIVPKLQKEIFIRLTDPKGYQFVSMLPVEEGDLLLDYNMPLAPPEVKTKASLRSAVDQQDPADYDSFFKSGLNKATELGKGDAMVVGGIYKITDKSFTDVVAFPDGKFTLYVGEGCTIRLGKEKTILKDGAEVYVLRDAAVVSAVAQSVDLELDGGRVYNAGTIKLQTISMRNPNGIYPILYNHPGGTVRLKAMELDGANVYNHCLINADKISLSGAGCNICLYENSSLISELFVTEKGAAGSSFYLYAKSLFETDTFMKKNDSYLSIYGDQGALSTADYPLMKVNGKMDCSFIVVYWRLLVYAEKFSGNLSGALSFDGKIPSNLTGECFDVEYVPGDEGFTDDSNSDLYDPQGQETQAYIYLFEDNWPGIGDYDMNDVVVNVGVMNRMQGSNTIAALITGQLIAVGGKKDLYVFAQIDGTDKVVNLLGGKEAHAFMGNDTRDMINTYGFTCEPVSFNVDIDVKGMQGLVNANNLNVFIVWGDPDSQKRNEIHVAGFSGTKQAASSDNCTKDYKFQSNDAEKSINNNLMWALMLPKNLFSSYPKEGNSIMDAYPGFNEWAKSGGKSSMDWYTAGVKDKLFSKN